MKRKYAILSCALSLLSVLAPAQTGTGKVCLAPVPKVLKGYSSPEVQCASLDFTVQIDDRVPIALSETKSILVDKLDIRARHMVVVRCDGKPNQTFRFRFADYESQKLCFFIHGLYKTAQLWEDKQCPWCKCRE